MARNGRLAGKVALVTGAAQGIGEGIARVFIEHGATVVLADIQADRSKSLAVELGEAANFVQLDVRAEDDWQRAIADIIARHGQLDILVNNAGTGIAGPIEHTGLADHRRVVELNLDAVWLGIRSAVDAMAAGGGGSIINISSIDGLVGVPHLSSYVATKFAVTGMTRSLAIELGARNIRVNSIHPGIIETPLLGPPGNPARQRLQRTIDRQPIGRLGQPRDIGYAALFFASEESTYCTGSSLVVDGGHIAGPYRDPVDS
jgi:3alpha(or 20beta)-hydroxysteroid dehydrogenase